MRRSYINKVIFMTLISLTFSTSVNAEWYKENDRWIWNENQEKSIGWKEVENNWYHFDENGYMSTGWVQYNDKWYHMSLDGIMDTGWKEINNEWYMFDECGIMLTGWINDNDTWYYADPSGKLEKGSISINGKNYTFSENGAMLSGPKNEIMSSNQIDYNKKGYVNTNNNFLNVRSEASIESSIVDKLYSGTEVNIIGNIQNGFYPIMLNKKNVWVSSEWISFEKPIDNQSNIENNKENNKENSTVTLGDIRTTAPSLNDNHYYSDSNIFYKVKLSPPFFSNSGNLIKGNCTWYAWGRAWELTGKPPIDANFIGNACEWWEANKQTGKYKYGTEPKVGAIAVWNSSLPGSGGCGHVAIVEKIDNNKTYISESMWHGDCFKYQEIYSTEYLYGYIYLDEPNY